MNNPPLLVLIGLLLAVVFVEDLLLTEEDAEDAEEADVEEEELLPLPPKIYVPIVLIINNAIEIIDSSILNKCGFRSFT
jgi:hypothetical protein